MRFTDQVALITAAASGIGRATAEIIGAEGGTVVGVDTDQSRLDALTAAIRSAGGRAHGRRADALDAAQVSAVVGDVVREHGRIDILVTAAGTATFGSVAESRMPEWDEMLAVNLRGAVLCCRAVVPAMTTQRRGTIINIGSVVTSRVLTGSAGYTTSKYGLLGFSRVLAEELRPHEVRVGLLSAGATDTPLWDAIPGAPARERMLRPQQVADAALLMAALAPTATLEELTVLPAGGVL
jgi:3-oxoacyl-[acyl-carrier protein] reductase